MVMGISSAMAALANAKPVSADERMFDVTELSGQE
jgi:hypothetical protein